MPNNSLYRKSRDIIQAIITNGIKDLIEKDEKYFHENIGKILANLPSTLFQGMVLTKSLNLDLDKEDILKKLALHPYLKSQISESIIRALNHFLEHGQYLHLAKYSKTYESIIESKPALNVWLDLGLDENLNNHFYKNELSEIKKIKMFFPNIFEAWIKANLKNVLNKALSDKWIEGIDFILGEDKAMMLNSSFLYDFINQGEYKPVLQLMRAYPKRFPDTMLMPKILRCIYFGNLNQLQEIQQTFPQAFKTCLAEKNGSDKSIMDILADEKTSGKYSKGLSLFSNKKSIKVQLNNFSCGKITDDKMLRTRTAVNYKAIQAWLEIIDPKLQLQYSKLGSP